VELDRFVQEGSGVPSLFDTERLAKRCAKDLWPHDDWVIKPESYIKESLSYDEHCIGGLCQPVPRLTVTGEWVCPITNKLYKKLTKRVFTTILVGVQNNPGDYMNPCFWKAFNYGSDWICPYTGKTFKKSGKRLEDHLAKQREIFAKETKL
jgi:hypothetical protein